MLVIVLSEVMLPWGPLDRIASTRPPAPIHQACIRRTCLRSIEVDPAPDLALLTLATRLNAHATHHRPALLVMATCHAPAPTLTPSLAHRPAQPRTLMCTCNLRLRIDSQCPMCPMRGPPKADAYPCPSRPHLRTALILEHHWATLALPAGTVTSMNPPRETCHLPPRLLPLDAVVWLTRIRVHIGIHQQRLATASHPLPVAYIRSAASLSLLERDPCLRTPRRLHIHDNRETATKKATTSPAWIVMHRAATIQRGRDQLV